jgi:hypothetical protein
MKNQTSQKGIDRTLRIIILLLSIIVPHISRAQSYYVQVGAGAAIPFANFDKVERIGNNWTLNRTPRIGGGITVGYIGKKKLGLQSGIYAAQTFYNYLLLPSDEPGFTEAVYFRRTVTVFTIPVNITRDVRLNKSISGRFNAGVTFNLCSARGWSNYIDPSIIGYNSNYGLMDFWWYEKYPPKFSPGINGGFEIAPANKLNWLSLGVEWNYLFIKGPKETQEGVYLDKNTKATYLHTIIVDYRPCPIVVQLKARLYQKHKWHKVITQEF